MQSNLDVNGLQRTRGVNPAVRGPNGASSVHSPHGSRVLVVDDDETLQAIVRLCLGKDGLLVETAGSGTAGLARLAAAPPDLVVLDIMLPDLSGWEVLRRIREASDVPILILSARDSGVDKARGLDLGADDYLTKPFDLLELEARVRALLRRARLAASPDAPRRLALNS